MINDDYEAARKIAKKNLRNIQKDIPRTLADREERLVESIGRLGDDPLVRLEKLYNFMDELYSFVARYTACTRGCSHCCHIEIEISAIEAEHIEKSLGIKRNPNLVKSSHFGTPCPFLKNGSCSIYRHRPFVCRRHVALFDNPKWCEIGVCNSYSFPQLRFTEVDKCHKLITCDNGRQQWYDIRQLFTQIT